MRYTDKGLMNTLKTFPEQFFEFFNAVYIHKELFPFRSLNESEWVYWRYHCRIVSAYWAHLRKKRDVEVFSSIT